MRKRLVFIFTWTLFVSLLSMINAQQISAATTLTTCTSFKSSVQYLAKDGKCNERIYESSTWYQMGTVPKGTPGSKIISINACQSKSRPDLILIRTRCNNKTQITTTWHRPLGPPAAPSIVTITAGALGTATVIAKAPTDNGGARITSFSLSANPTKIEGKTERVSSTYKPNSSGEIKISGLIPGDTYIFTLVANNAVGISAPSQASVPFLAPTVPTSPAITAVVATGTNSALITYTSPAFDGGSPITSYTATSSPGGVQSTAYRSSAGTIEVTGLTSSTIYTFTIVANNFAGSSLPSTISAAITTFSPPPPPPAVEAPAPAPAPTLAAPAFTLSTSSETRTVNIAATGFTINSTGGLIASFAINATPAGMSFSTSTGALTGTPTSVATATAYTITATNATGSTNQTFTLTVEAALAAPDFTLSSSSETRTVNIAATGFTISSTGGLISSFTISATPAGMGFSTSTGALSGTPTSVATATAYTITATNATGSTTQTFTLTVEVAPALPAFTISSSSETRGVNAQAAGFTVSSTGGAVASYSITPTPVTSMTFNTTTGKLSGWTGTVAGVTTYTVTATNSSGTATRTFALTVTPGGANKVAISRASVGTAKGLSFTVQPQITIQDGYANTVTSSTAVVTATISAGGTLIGTTTATASSGVATFGNLGISGTVGTNYAVTYTVEGLTFARQSITVTDYAIGSIGPGGGRVFYIAATTFASPGSTCNTSGVGGISTCKYLEVSPSTWKTGSVASDLGYAWSTNISVSTGQNRTTSSTEGVVANSANEKFNWKIGQGFYNTSVMKVDGATSAAQAAVLAYAATDSSAGQWFIPSTNELNELCKYARGQTTGDLTVKCVVGSGTFKSTENAGSDLGGFVTGWYWSSSEWVVHPQGAWYQSFRDGSQDADGKSNALYLRPVRAFGAGSAAKVAITRASVGTQRRTAFTTQPQITIQDSGGTTITSSAAVVTATVSAGGTLVGTTTSTASSGVATFTGLGVDGTIGTSYTITYTTVGLTVATATVTLIGTTCDGTTFTCQVGDTGPGGGKIFYYSAAGFSCGSAFSATGSPTGGKCYYLEVAPKTWDGASDPLKPWAVTAKNNELVNATGDSNSVGIGHGYQNSDLIVVQNGTYNATNNNYAAGAARAYSGGSKNDWYLPAIPELNELYKWANSDVAQPALGTVGVDGTLNFAANGFTIEFDFASVYYWSSSEDAPNHAWNQSFNHSKQEWNVKSDDSRRVRPIRAF